MPTCGSVAGLCRRHEKGDGSSWVGPLSFTYLGPLRDPLSLLLWMIQRPLSTADSAELAQLQGTQAVSFWEHPSSSELPLGGIYWVLCNFLVRLGFLCEARQCPATEGCPGQGQWLTATAPTLVMGRHHHEGPRCRQDPPLSSGHLGTRPWGRQDRDCMDRSVSGPVRACLQMSQGLGPQLSRHSHRDQQQGREAVLLPRRTVKVSECCLTHCRQQPRPGHFRKWGTAGVTQGQVWAAVHASERAARAEGAGSAGMKGQPQEGKALVGEEQKDQASPGHEWSADRRENYTARGPWDAGSRHLQSSPRGPAWTQHVGWGHTV